MPIASTIGALVPEKLRKGIGGRWRSAGSFLDALLPTACPGLRSHVYSQHGSALLGFEGIPESIKKRTEELLALAKEEGVELFERDLEAISGGFF